MHQDPHSPLLCLDNYSSVARSHYPRVENHHTTTTNNNNKFKRKPSKKLTVIASNSSQQEEQEEEEGEEELRRSEYDNYSPFSCQAISSYYPHKNDALKRRKTKQKNSKLALEATSSSASSLTSQPQLKRKSHTNATQKMASNKLCLVSSSNNHHHSSSSSMTRTPSFLLIGLIALSFSLSETPLLVSGNLRISSVPIPTSLAIDQHFPLSKPQTPPSSSLNKPEDSASSSHEQKALNYLLFSNSRTKPQAYDIKLNDLLKDSNHSHVSDTIDLTLANSVWARMRQNALEFAQQKTKEARPTINRLLSEANISAQCRQSLNDVLDRLAHLDNWAVQMYNSFGDFPTAGFFEGSLTSMGSYHQCVDLEPNRLIGKAQYCTFKFQPIVPKRPKYHNILARVENLANFTTKDDMFHELAKRAQYYYYVKLRMATCMPSKCENNDLEQLGKQVAINTYLQYSGVSCLQKETGFNPDGAQIFAMSILIFLASVSVLGTLVHVLDLRSYISCDNGTSTNDAKLKTKKSSDLNGKSKGHFNSNQVVIQQQSLLVANQQKAPILVPPVIVQTSVNSVNSSKSLSSASTSSSSSRFNSQLLYICDVLIHFSIVKNGRKLFDTSTSRRGGTRTIIPDLRNPSSSSGDTTPSSSRSESGSVDDTGGGGRSNDISCVHGLRFWTISWIIFGHTMQYTEWSGFARAYQVEKNIVSFFLQPLMNATFSVDTFFLVSGLLTTYVTWTITRGQYKRFNKFAFLISRYLRLTPQVLLVILLFIVFPMIGDGPYWRGLIQKESDNCKRNWWVNALYLQAFIKQDQICNLVTWWLSIEMFYHFVSIIVIIALLHSSRKGIITALVIGGSMTGVSCYLHFVNYYPPNMLPTLLQRYEIWDSIVLKYFWTPYPHAAAYFVGLLLGYMLYNKSISKLTKAQVRYGWLAFVVCYLTILFGTYNWNNNAPYARLTSTVYYNVSQVFWSLATGWAILACALGHGGWLNSFLSSPVFVPLGRATYMTYLSHMIIVMSYPAKMNLLIEPSYIVFLYIFISNLFLSYVLGIFLTLVYESPILHLQKLLVSNMANKFNDNDSVQLESKINQTEKVVRVSLYTQQVESNDTNR